MFIKALNKDFKVTGDLVILKKLTNLKKELSEQYFKFQENEDENILHPFDMVIGEIVDIGHDTKKTNIGDKVVVQVSMLRGVLDLFENEHLLDNEQKNYYIVPERLILGGVDCV